MVTVNVLIEDVRKRKGITRIHVAKAVGKTPSWYTKMVRGRANVTVDMLPSIAEALGETPQYFLARIDETENSKELTSGKGSKEADAL